MEYQYSEKGNYDYSQQQQYPPQSVMPYPGPEQQGPPPTIIPAENHQPTYTYNDAYSQQQEHYIPTMPEANQNNNNQYNQPPEVSYNNNQYNSPPEVASYNNNQYNSPPEVASYNNNQYNSPPEPSYNNNQYIPPPEPYNNNQYIPPPEPSYNTNTYNSQPEPSYNTLYNSPPPQQQQTSYSNNSYNSAPEPSYTTPNQPSYQPPSYDYNNNNVYSSSSSNVSPHLTKPYSRTQNYNNTQSSSASAPPSVPPSNNDDKTPKPPKNYSSPSSSYTPSHTVAPNQSRPTQEYVPPPSYGGTKRPSRNNCDCADCFSICGCIRCTCTIITFVMAALFIAAGIFLLGYSKTLPGKCQGICDPTNGGIQNIGNLPSSANDPINKINNEINGGTQQCSNLCKDSVFKILFYGGIGFIGLGALMALTQILCMCCRVGSSGGRGTGCCYCC